MDKGATFVRLGASNHTDKERELDDFYATDPKALEIFLQALERDNLKLHSNIWECACGQGHLSKVLEDKGYNVWSTDLIDRGYGKSGIDFLTYSPNEKWNGDILTNPPYKYAKEFVEKGLELVNIGNYVVMLLKIQFLEGQARLKLFKQYPPRYVYVNSKRQQCAKNGDFETYSAGVGTAICYCWFVWQKGFKGDPIIRWI